MVVKFAILGASVGLVCLLRCSIPGRVEPMRRSETMMLEGGAMGKEVICQPIGIIRSPYAETKGTPIQGVFGDEREAFVELGSEYAPGLKDLDGFSHAFVICHFHRSAREEVLVSPYLEKERRGVFATRSPHRPNRIGLSVVRIKWNEGNRLYFTEVDMLDGTPVLDIKPYIRQFDCRTNAVSGWVEEHFRDGAVPEGRADR